MKHSQHLVAIAVCASALAGCGHSPMSDHYSLPPSDILSYPTPPLAPYSSPYVGQFNQIAIAKNHASVFLIKLNVASEKRGTNYWDNGDFTSVGAIAAVAGAVAGQPGLMNTGAGMSVVGLSSNERYSYEIQYRIYETARLAVGCIIRKVDTTSDTEVYWGTIQTNPETLAAASGLAPGIVEATERVRNGLISQLQAVKNEPITTGSFKALVDEQMRANKAIGDARQGLTDGANSSQAKMLGYVSLAPQTEAQKAEKARLELENRLVPPERRTEVGLKLIGLLPEINACTTPYL